MRTARKPAPEEATKTSWPRWATEEVSLSEPNPRWEVTGENLAKALGQELAPWLVAGPHHVGSTSVPDLVSKPIIDLMAAIPSLAIADDIEEVLQPKGWYLVPPSLDDRPYRILFVKVEAEKRAAHLHLMRQDGPRWTEQLAFRDALRASPELRGQYGEIKRHLAREHRTDREAYTKAKSSFIHSVLSSHGCSEDKRPLV